MRITLPKGFELPENARPGEPFEVVATLEMNEDGTFELEAIDGMEIEGESETEPPETEPPEAPMAGIRLPWAEEEE